MASSRLEKVGTIFTRASGLLKSGAMKHADKPVWYDVYRAFPPAFEPRVDRSVPEPDEPIRQILYEEDEIRARFYRRFRHVPAVDLNETRTPGPPFLAQRFVVKYLELKSRPESGNLGPDDVFRLAVDAVMAENDVDLTKFEAPPPSKRRRSLMTTTTAAAGEDGRSNRVGGKDESLSDAFSAAVLSSGRSPRATRINVSELLKDMEEDGKEDL